MGLACNCESCLRKVWQRRVAGLYPVKNTCFGKGLGVELRELLWRPADGFEGHGRDTAGSTPPVVPGAAPALAKAGVKVESFEVVDWDGDQKLDFLSCIRDENRSGSTRVILHKHSVFETDGISTGSVIVSVDRSTSCDLRAVDFDEDGDIDLFVGQERYFERLTPAKLVERSENPLAMFGGQLVQLVDIDGDGHLDVIQRGSGYLRFFRRSLDGRFIEPLENPVAGIPGRFVNIKASETRMDRILAQGYYTRIVHVADWDSDGLLDLFYLEFGHEDPSNWGLRWGCQKYYRHLVNRDLKYNSHFTSYEDIETSGDKTGNLQFIDWDKDGWDDVVVKPDRYWQNIYLYEVNGNKAQKVSGVLDEVTPIVESLSLLTESVALVDWDGDGSMDLIAIGDVRLVFHQMVSGKFQANPHHPLSQIRFAEESDRQIVPVDWDQDGDMDLFVIELWNEKGQYFEQQHDGSVKERPIEFGAPLVLPPHLDFLLDESLGWHFLDCDGDGDMDLVRSRNQSTGQVSSADPTQYYTQIQACERKEDGSLRCDDDFRCLGTDLSLWNPSAFAEFGKVVKMSVGRTEDGRLKILAAHKSRRHSVLWTAGFCKPKDSCNQKGACIARQANCECNRGYELKDCSRCEPQYYTASLDARHMRSCEECPGEVGGQVCYERGRCFDDVAAQAVTKDYAATLAATGNGSCLCYEVRWEFCWKIGREWEG
eukprot:s1206_g33.t1